MSSEPENLGEISDLRPQPHGGALKSGNTEGVGRPPKGFSITELAREMLEREDKKGARELAKALIENAKSGNSSAMKELLDRLDGPVTQKIDINNVPNEKLIQIIATEET